MIFKREAVAGFEWNGLSTLVTSAFQFIQVAALSVFLSPTSFGIMAMAMVVIGFAQAFNDIGVSNAIIQRRDTTIENLSSLYWLQVVLGIILFFTMILITPLAVQFFREPALSGVMTLTSLTFLVTPLGLIFQILMQKNLEFKRLALVDMSSSFISLVVAVSAAYLGFGVMALVWGQLTFYGIRSIQFFIVGWRRWRLKLHFRWSDLKGFLSFGLYQIGERSVTFFSINVLNLIIGRFLGANMLGLYSMAYQLIITPILKISTVIITVSFPIFSRFQNVNALLKEGYLYISRFISFTICPILLTVIVTAPVFVPILLGPKWIAVIPLIQILSIEAIIKSLVITSVPTYLAKGGAEFGFKWNLLVAIMNSITFYLIAGYGIITLAWAFVCLSFIQYIFLQVIMDTLIELKWTDYAKTLITQFLISLTMALIVFLAYVNAKNMGGIELLVFLVAMGFVSYALLNLIFNNDYLIELKRLILKMEYYEP